MTRLISDSDHIGGVEPLVSMIDWQAQLLRQATAFGAPLIKGQIKASPQDFRVTELMDITPSGEGEHHLLKVTKVRYNTEQVAKALARFAGVALRDVGYSGMKDFQAVTSQWFSLCKPKGDDPNWSEFKLPGVTIESAGKHNRKIKRGAHRGNEFEIVVRGLSGDIASLEPKLRRVSEQGVPNYFGAQRFGRNAQNMIAACDMLLRDKQVKSRNLRGILLSSVRAWLFNQVLSERISNETWQCLYANEPANLDGSNSVFIAVHDEHNASRLLELDIHPTAPLYGEGGETMMSECEDLYNFEMDCLSPHRDLMNALVSQRVNYQRRALRSVVHDLSYELSGDALLIKFRLQRGQFATSVLRELIA